MRRFNDFLLLISAKGPKRVSESRELGMLIQKVDTLWHDVQGNGQPGIKSLVQQIITTMDVKEKEDKKRRANYTFIIGILTVIILAFEAYNAHVSSVIGKKTGAISQNADAQSAQTMIGEK